MNTKQLRQKILSLAIRGKLVPQDPNDEPASVLLERIRAEREKLVKSGKIKRDKRDSVISCGENKSHYENLPDGWVWCRLCDIGQIVGGGTPRTDEQSYWNNGKIPWITSADLSGYQKKYIAEGSRNITDKGLAESSATLMPAGSVLFSSRASIGYVAIAENELCTNQGFNSIVPYIIELSEYIYYYLKAQVEEIRTRAYGTTLKGITGTEFGKTLLFVPPLAEQYRIVSAIESAFAVVDEIETARDTLSVAIATAKSKILSLAIRGKLVPQDSNDEPASVLLERIRAEREKLVKSGKIKRSKGGSVIFRGDDNSYYENLPDGWVVVPIERLFSAVGGGTPSTGKTEYWGGGIPWFSSADIDENGSITPRRCVTQCGVEKSATNVVPKDSVVVVTRVGLGKVAILNCDMCFSQDIQALIPYHHKVIYNRYLFHFLLHEMQSLKYLGRGTTISGITKKQLTDICMGLPPINEQKRIVKTIEIAFSTLDEIVETLK